MYNIAVNCGFVHSSCVINVDLVLPNNILNTAVTNEIAIQM